MTENSTQKTNHRLAQPRLSAPPKQGLYDPQFEHDSCGVGFVVNMKGKKSHQLVTDALQILVNLDHRGACGCEANTGDGAGILMQMPHEFFAAKASGLGFKLPAQGQYGTGMLFLPKNPAERDAVKAALAKIIADEGQTVLGWRDIPTDNSSLGKTAVAAEPHMMQVFVGRNPALKDELAFERKLYVIRKVAEQQIRYGGKIPGGKWFYVSSLSSRTVIYKGMLMPEQVGKYYPDLRDASMATALALVHSRFSTNTFPSWDRVASVSLHRAQRRNQHAARQHQLDALGAGEFQIEIVRRRPQETDSRHQHRRQRLGDVRQRGGIARHGRPRIAARDDDDDSRAVGKSREHGRRSAARSTNTIPASSNRGTARLRWRSRTARCIGACLDRNGLRPSRYYVTKDDVVIMASEAGVLPVAPERVASKGRLQPGRMFLVDTEQGRIIADEELKKKYASAHPYREWLDKYHLLLENLPALPEHTEPTHRKILAIAAGVRLHVRGFAFHHRPDGARRRAAARLDGHGHAAGGAVEQAAIALQLFQAAFRAGHESAD